MRVEIVKADPSHCNAIAEHVRDADRAELWAVCCIPPWEALIRCWAISDHSWAGIFDGEPVCMFGVTQASLLTDTGRPWMISTTAVDRYPLSFLRKQQSFMPHVRRGYARLENYVDVRNTRSIRWLKWLGFAMGEAQPYGALKLPFYKFSMEIMK